MKSVHHMTPDEIDDRITEIQRNYIGFFKDAHDGFYISTREGRFLDCNEALVRICGLSRPRGGSGSGFEQENYGCT